MALGLLLLKSVFHLEYLPLRSGLTTLDTKTLAMYLYELRSIRALNFSVLVINPALRVVCQFLTWQENLSAPGV